MAKTRISEFDVDPSLNTDINSINIAEGCAPSGINNAIRQLMSDLKEFQTGAGGDSITAVGVYSDTIGEKTSAAGVTVDGVLIKDNAVTASGGFSGALNGAVGGTTPAAGAFTTLSASGAFSANGGATLGDASGDALTINSSAVSIPNGLNFDSNTFVIDATNNNVGIGTTSPTQKLHLAVGSASAIYNRIENTAGNCYLGLLASGDTVLSADSSGNQLLLYTSATERARIDSSGNLLVGTTTASVGSGAGIKSLPAGDGANNPILAITTSGSTSATAPLQIFSTGANAYRFYVSASGQINATSTSITAISDQRLKENIRPLDLGLAQVMDLKPRRYDWKEGKGQDKKDAVGFIAQEFETVLPNSVGTSKAGGDGIEYKTINYEELVPTLVKAIQELNAKVTALEAQLNK